MKYVYTVYLLFVVCLVAAFFFGFTWTNAEHQYETQQICDRSRAVISGSLEQACGDVQQRYGTEYLCNNLQPSAVCWTEVK